MSINRQQGIGMTSGRTRDRLVARLVEQGIKSKLVLDAIRNTLRHLFIEDALSSRAYEDVSLPIGHGQTISQPYIVARMTEALLEGRDQVNRVLEIGTGCGYQTAVLSKVVDKIYTVERIVELFRSTRDHLYDQKIRNVEYAHADGSVGWLDKAPFDGIVVTAAASVLPEELLPQLADKGRLIIPVGGDDTQRLLMIERNGDQFQTTELEWVRFVPLISGRVS